MAQYYALIDPNWGEPRVILETIAATRQEAERKAVKPTVESARMYSGASEFPLPLGTDGTMGNLNNYGFHVKPIEVEIK